MLFRCGPATISITWELVRRQILCPSQVYWICINPVHSKSLRTTAVIISFCGTTRLSQIESGTVLILLFYFLYRSPPLTMLFLCATKFSASSAGTDITVFLSSDPSSLPKVPVTSSEAKTQESGPVGTVTKKATNSLESFFQKAAEKQKVKEASLLPLTATTQTPVSNSPSKPSLPFQTSSTTGSEPFFKQKTLLLKQKQLNDPSVFFHPQKPQSSPKELPTEYPDGGPACENALKLDSAQATPAEVDLAQNSSLTSKSALEEATATLSLLAAEDQVLCEKCGSLVPVWETPEHSDYHFALELQKSFLQPHSSTSQAVPARSPQSKRNPKSPLASSHKRPRPEGMLTLETFFKPLTH